MKDNEKKEEKNHKIINEVIKNIVFILQIYNQKYKIKKKKIKKINNCY